MVRAYLRVREEHPMIASILGLMMVVLMVAMVRWVASVPLVRILSVSIDQWADGVQGAECDPPR